MKCINKQQDTQKRSWALDIMKMGCHFIFVSLKAGFQRTFERVSVLYAVTLRQLLFNGCLDIIIHYFIAYIGLSATSMCRKK